MMSKNNYNKFKNFFLKVLIAIFILITIGISYSIFKEFKKSEAVQDKIENLKIEAERIERENMQIQDKITYLESQEYKEKEARDKLNLQNPEEKLVILKTRSNEKKIETDEKPTQITSSVSQLPNWQKWWNYFFHQ